MAQQNRKTEIMNTSPNITQILNNSNLPRSQKTELQNKKEKNVTAAMGQSIHIPLELVIGSSIKDYIVKDVLTENTGEATLLLVEKENSLYVLKLYHLNKRPKQEMIDIINKVKSPYVIHHLDSGECIGRYYEVLPYYIKGDLLKNMPISNKEIEQIIIPCINEGLHILHENGIIHRDIKPSNIFYSNDKKHVVIGDFGISSILNNGISVRATSMSRTLGYAAPETSIGFISKESDYYSFGITLLHLILQQDPFAGMTEMQILYQTINKKFDLPQNTDARLSRLIKGLSIKDRIDRWGYSEVLKWLNNIEVPIIEKESRTKGIKPYQFNKCYYSDLESLSMAFANDWENAKKHLYRGFVEKNIIQYGEELASRCIDLKEFPDKDVAVFRLIYLINNEAPLCYKGVLFNDLESLGMKMASQSPTIDYSILEMVSNGSLVHFLTIKNYDSKLINKVDLITEEIKKKNFEYYFALMYCLYPQIGFNVNGDTFQSLNELITYLERLDEKTIEQISSNLFENKMFHMWIYAQGYTRQLREWLEIYKKAKW